jgi:lambda repressor-like predicted transcriptional regulator
MEETQPRVNCVPCRIVEVRYEFPSLPCDHCQQAAEAVDHAERTAIDLHLNHPTLLHITISVHYCASCGHYFRAQPSFLRPDAIYTNRVVMKAVQSVFEDAMAKRRVTDRLARDFWVKPSETSIRNWCKTYQAGFNFDTDYQPWAIRSFSGVLCVDEVYQGELALLLAVDPAAPQGDRLMGYQLIQGTVDADKMETFLSHLRELGISPEEVITDGSSLYPATLKKVWPTAVHQLCLFHETRHVTKGVMEAIQDLRKALPAPPPAERQGKGGPIVNYPPSEDPNHPAVQRWRQRRQERQAGIEQVQCLSNQGLSQRAIARQTGLNRRTVKQWLKEPIVPVEPVTKTELILSQEERWEQPASSQRTNDIPQPPAPWKDWDDVRQVREALQEYRFLFVKQPRHLTDEERVHMADLLSSPIGVQLQMPYEFMKDWYAFWRTSDDRRLPVEEAVARYRAWQACEAYQQIKPLQRVLERITPRRFRHLSHFLTNPRWEATNNGAERAGRDFRHKQAPHFNLRSKEEIEGMITVHAVHQMQRSLSTPYVSVGLPTRGRLPA